MNDAELDRRLAAWLDEAAPRRAPDTLLSAPARAVERTRPMPAWLALLTERPMRQGDRVTVGSTPLRAVYLTALAALIVALAAAAVVGGSRLLPPRPLPPPFGPAANGLIAFDTHGAVMVANPDGTGVRTLVADRPGASSATWAPDGTRLAFYAEPPEVGPTEIWIVDADGSHLARLAADLWIASDKRPSWSPDGRRLVISAESGPNRNDERLFILNVDGSAMSEVGSTHPRDPIRRLLPSWSPDGQWIAYEGIAMSEPLPAARLYVIRPDGSDEQVLPTAGRYGFEPPGAEWLGDAARERLVYTAGESEDTRDVYVFDVATGRETRISRAATWEFGPSWSPDGNRIAWYDAGDSRGPAIRIASADGLGDITTLYATGIGAAFVRWSPDGTRLYGASEGNTALIVVSVDGSGPVKVIPHAAGQGWPTWQRVAP